MGLAVVTCTTALPVRHEPTDPIADVLLQSEASASWDCLCYEKDTTYDAEKCDQFHHMASKRFHMGTQAPCKPINPDRVTANDSDRKWFQQQCCAPAAAPLKPPVPPAPKPPAKPCEDHPKWAKKGKCSKKCSGKCSKKCLKKCPRTCGVCEGETLLQSEASGSWDCFCSVKDTTYDTEKCEKLEHMAKDRFSPERDPKTGTCKAHRGSRDLANPSDARFFQDHCCRHPDGSFPNDPIGPVKPPVPTPPTPPTKGCADDPKWAKKKCSKKCSGTCSKKCLKKCPLTCGAC